MDTNEVKLLKYLIRLCCDLSWKRHGNVEKLFELTKEGTYPPGVIP